MFDHGKHVDDVFLTKGRPVSGVKQVLLQLYLKAEEKCLKHKCHIQNNLNILYSDMTKARLMSDLDACFDSDLSQ